MLREDGILNRGIKGENDKCKDVTLRTIQVTHKRGVWMDFRRWLSQK